MKIQKKIIFGLVFIGIVLSLTILFSIFLQPQEKKPISLEGLTAEQIIQARLTGTYQEVHGGITPQNPLYFFDTFGERLCLHFTGNKRNRVFKAILFHQEKIQEIELLFPLQKNTPKKIKNILAQQKYLLAIIKNLLPQIYKKDISLGRDLALWTNESFSRSEFQLEILAQQYNSDPFLLEIQKNIQDARNQVDVFLRYGQ